MPDSPKTGGPTERAEAPAPFDPDRRVVAVTGPRSALGRDLIARLEADDRYARVVACDVEPPRDLGPKSRFHPVDLTQPGADARLASGLVEHRADTLVHLALLTRPSHEQDWAHELEAIGTLHTLNAAAACRLHKVVVWSLTAVYGARPDNPAYFTEEDTPRGVDGSRFFADKLEAERLVRRFARENPSTATSLLRTAFLVGPRAEGFAARYLSLPAVPVIAGYDPLVQVLHQEDAADAFKLATDANFPGVFNLAAPGVLPLRTALGLMGRVPVPLLAPVARRIFAALWTTQILEMPPTLLDFLRYPCLVDTARATGTMGFAPRFRAAAALKDMARLDPPGSETSRAAGVWA